MFVTDTSTYIEFLPCLCYVFVYFSFYLLYTHFYRDSTILPVILYPKAIFVFGTPSYNVFSPSFCNV